MTAPAAIALYSPRIARNVGAIGRVCAATGAVLHVIRPIPFQLDDKALRRAGMDYWAHVDLRVHDSFAEFAEAAGEGVWLFTTHGSRSHVDAPYAAGDCLLFGNEPHGVPDDVRAAVPSGRHLRVPMPGPAGRSLNLATTVAVGLYEALRCLRALS